jgi:formiminotetrahydrofolate cyclodeaminase
MRPTMLDRPFTALIAELSARTPTGGGAAAGMAACMGIALWLMVLRYSRGKKATLARDAELEAAERKLAELLAATLPMAERDCAAFAKVGEAARLPRTSPDEQRARDGAVDAALLGAMDVPLELLDAIEAAGAAMRSVADAASRTICSDLAAGAHLLGAAAETCALNVRANAASLRDQALAGSRLARARAARAAFAGDRDRVLALAERLLQ